MRGRQLQFFSATEVASMRDRTRARNYSAMGAEFRKVHERHRAWGLAQRHAEKLRRLRNSPPDPQPVSLVAGAVAGPRLGAEGARGGAVAEPRFGAEGARECCS